MFICRWMNLNDDVIGSIVAELTTQSLLALSTTCNRLREHCLRALFGDCHISCYGAIEHDFLPDTLWRFVRYYFPLACPTVFGL